MASRNPAEKDQAGSTYRSPRSPRSGRSQRRPASVYDAVAGRVTLSDSLRIPIDRGLSRNKAAAPIDHHTSRDVRLPPDQVLFGRKHAPERFAEKDTYFANEHLPENGRRVLPDSDLLTTVHSYASNFYDALALRQGPIPAPSSRLVDERSMDETALLAFGILLEEASRHALGGQGDLVFTEERRASEEPTPGATEHDEGQGKTPRKSHKRRKLSSGALEE